MISDQYYLLLQFLSQYDTIYYMLRLLVLKSNTDNFNDWP